MNRYNVNVLAEAKKEYTAQLVNTITPEVYIGVKSMYSAASEFCKRTNEKNVLIKFQTLLAKTPNWNQEKIENEFSRIEKATNCDYLADLLTAIFVSHTKVLASLKMKKNIQSFELDVPNGPHFIHKVYIECARKFWKYPYLLHTEFPNLELQRNLLQAENFIKECIEETIRKLLPVRYVLKECLGEDYNDDDDVEEDIKSSISNNTKNNLRKLIKFEIEQTLSRQSESDEKFSKVEIKENLANSELEDLIEKTSKSENESSNQDAAQELTQENKSSENKEQEGGEVKAIQLDPTDLVQIEDVTNSIIKQISNESLEASKENDEKSKTSVDNLNNSENNQPVVENVEESDNNNNSEHIKTIQLENPDNELPDTTNKLDSDNKESDVEKLLLTDNNEESTVNTDDLDNEEDTVNTDDLDNLQDDNEENTVNTNESQLKDNNLETSANLQKEQPQPEVKENKASTTETQLKNIDLVITEKIEKTNTDSKKQENVVNKPSPDAISLSKLQSLEEIRNEINQEIVENSNDTEGSRDDDEAFSFFDDAANF